MATDSDSGSLSGVPLAWPEQPGDLPRQFTSRAGLAGIAVLAGSTIVAEPERVAADAVKAGVFVIGVAP